MKQKIKKAVDEAVEAAKQLQTLPAMQFIENVAKIIADAFENGHKIIIAGNGGSLCDAQHFAEELTGFFRKPRPAYPAIALADPGHITCVGNDLGFEWIFSRGVEAYGKAGDVFIGLTTSGNSANIIHAVETAKKNGLKTVLFLGKGGGKLKDRADAEFCVDYFKTSDRIQEAHMAAIHIIIEIVEEILQETNNSLEKDKTKTSLACIT